MAPPTVFWPLLMVGSVGLLLGAGLVLVVVVVVRRLLCSYFLLSLFLRGRRRRAR